MGQPVDSILEFRIRSLVNAQECLTVFHYVVNTESSLPSSGGEETAFLDAMDTGGTNNMVPTYLAAMSDAANVIALEAQFVSPVRLVAVIQNVDYDGGIALPCNNQNIAGVITRRTRLAGRSQVSNTHMPGLPDEGVVAGFLTSTQRDKYAALLSKALLGVFPATGDGVYRPVIWHRVEPPLTQFDEVTAGTVQPTSRTMRRRTIGVGK